MKKTLALVVLALVAATVSAQARRELREESSLGTMVTVELLPEDHLSIMFICEYDSRDDDFAETAYAQILLAGEPQTESGLVFADMKAVANDLTPKAIVYRLTDSGRIPHMILFRDVDYGTQGSDKK